eukprot:2313317-Pleurochrysis_carterae.AAC.1
MEEVDAESTRASAWNGLRSDQCDAVARHLLRMRLRRRAGQAKEQMHERESRIGTREEKQKGGTVRLEHAR